MITYNSERFIVPQIDTILANLEVDDELVISDDGSSDSTLSIIKDYMAKDNRIKLFQISHSGCDMNYSNAITHCSGDIIFLSDDDNVWSKDKVKVIDSYFVKNPKCLFIQHDCDIVDENLNKITQDTFYTSRKPSPSIFRNIVKNSFGGSLICFRKEFVKYILPLPKYRPVYYDEFFGLMACKHGHVIFINEMLSSWRRYAGTASTGFSNKKTKINPIKRFFIRMKIRFVKLWWAIRY